MLDKLKILIQPVEETLVLPFYYSGLSSQKRREIGGEWLENSDQNLFGSVEYPCDLIEIAKNDRVLYSHCAIGPGVASLVRSFPAIKLTLNDLDERIVNKAEVYLREAGLAADLEEPAVSPIEDLDPEFMGFDVAFTHAPAPLPSKAFLIYLDRTKSDGRVIGTTTGGRRFEPIWLLEEGSEVYDASFRLSVSDEFVYGSLNYNFFVGTVFNSPEVQRKVRQDLYVLRTLSDLIYPNGSEDISLSDDVKIYQPQGYELGIDIVREAMESEYLSIVDIQDSVYRLNQLAHLPKGLFTQGDAEGMRIRFV